jgi:hypothetical protein
MAAQTGKVLDVGVDVRSPGMATRVACIRGVARYIEDVRLECLG